ncbi:unnamed protein product [Ostreobium quekettii]|uniref:FHA domain-containing protein n=1 Tax=Ostreobium quekettii TaxID=121088 RepID=A0A8S1J952_9CHLO|nr:unnamed protein product [Ostreobium quekettii]
MEGYPDQRADPAGPPQRRRLVLDPRNEAKARQAAQTAKSSIFGEAKPREEVLAKRTGVAESEILRQEAEHERLHIRLSPQQLSDQREAEEAVAEVRRSLEQATDEAAISALKVELGRRQQELDSLLLSFEKQAVERAHAGGGIRPSERQRLGTLRDFDEGEDGGRHAGYGGSPHGGQPRGFADYGEPRDSYGQSASQPHRGGSGRFDEYGTSQGSGRGIYDDFGGGECGSCTKLNFIFSHVTFEWINQLNGSCANS